MLKVRTRLGPSSIHGLGLFADAPVPEGTEVWRFTPGFDLDVELSLLDGLPLIARRTLLHYGYIDNRRGRFILCCDDARFVNHRDNPNVAPHHGTDRYGVDIAVRSTRAGEEINL
jgi:hypothetical protein